MGESKFVKMKRIVEQEKDKKVRGEAKLASLGDEKTRIFMQLEKEIGQPVSSLEEAEKIGEDLRESIESDILKMEAILKEEGYLV